MLAGIAASGGTNDAVGRILARHFTERLGQSFLVDNRPGAGGNIGTALAAKAPRDGYTLLLTISSTQAINPALYRNTGFDPVASITSSNEVIRKFSTIGAEVLQGGPQQLATMVKEDMARWAPIVKASGAQVD